jgi:hypothetical protein
MSPHADSRAAQIEMCKQGREEGEGESDKIRNGRQLISLNKMEPKIVIVRDAFPWIHIQFCNSRLSYSMHVNASKCGMIVL